MNRNHSVPVIILLGPPGAGKGTQALFLSRKKSIPKISTGDMLRNAVQAESELGRRVKQIMEEGRLVDDDTMLSLVKERIAQSDCYNGFILDGYPRTIRQALQLEGVLSREMRLSVFNIDVSEEEIVKRIAGRRTCPQCNRIYNIYFHPPVEDETCDLDRTPLLKRADDEEEVVRKRIATYRKETHPLVEHYQEQGVLHLINGLQPADAVATRIFQKLNFDC